MTEPQARETCTKIFVTFGRAILTYANGETDNTLLSIVVNCYSTYYGRPVE